MPTILDHSVSGNPPDTERISHSPAWVIKFPTQYIQKCTKYIFSDIFQPNFGILGEKFGRLMLFCTSQISTSPGFSLF